MTVIPISFRPNEIACIGAPVSVFSSGGWSVFHQVMDVMLGLCRTLKLHPLVSENDLICYGGDYWFHREHILKRLQDLHMAAVWTFTDCHDEALPDFLQALVRPLMERLGPAITPVLPAPSTPRRVASLRRFVGMMNGNRKFDGSYKSLAWFRAGMNPDMLPEGMTGWFVPEGIGHEDLPTFPQNQGVLTSHAEPEDNQWRILNRSRLRQCFDQDDWQNHLRKVARSLTTA